MYMITTLWFVSKCFIFCPDVTDDFIFLLGALHICYTMLYMGGMQLVLDSGNTGVGQIISCEKLSLFYDH